MYPYFSGKRPFIKAVCVKEAPSVLMPENGSSGKMADIIGTAIDGEIHDRAFYEALTEQIGNEDRDIVESIISDETKHRRLLEYIYTLLTGETYAGNGSKPVNLSSSITDNLREAIMDETAAVKFYRELMMSSSTDEVRDLFFEIMTDEANHAALDNYLFAKYR